MKIPRILNDEEGSILDLAQVLIIVFSFSLTLIIGHFVVKEIHNADTNVEVVDDDLYDKFTTSYNVLSGGLVFIFVVLCVSVGAYAYYVKSNPLVLAVAFVFTALVVWLAAMLTDIFEIVGGQSELSGVANEYPLLFVLMENMPRIIVVVSVFVIIALYARSRRSGGGFVG